VWLTASGLIYDPLINRHRKPEQSDNDARTSDSSVALTRDESLAFDIEAAGEEFMTTHDGNADKDVRSVP
jgi:hypothetical protein